MDPPPGKSMLTPHDCRQSFESSNRTLVTIQPKLSRAGKCLHNVSIVSDNGHARGRSVHAPHGSPDARKLQPDPGDGPVVAAQSEQAQQDRS